MLGSRSFRVVAGAALVAVAALAAAPPVHAFRATFAHVLADFTGPVPLGEARVAIDPATGEIFVGERREVRVFNAVGMELFSFRTPLGLGSVLDLAVSADGTVYTLGIDLDAPGDSPRIALMRHDFRGVPQGEVRIVGAPAPFDRLLPNRVFAAGNRLVLASTRQHLAMAIRPDGAFERGLDLAEILEIAPEERDNLELSGLAIDDAGNLLVACAVLFRAFLVSPEGEVIASWGKPGSAAGTFGVVAGIARDAEDRTYVVDKIRGVVLVFDRNSRFLGEFGGERTPVGALGRPSDVFVDRDGRAYVTQVGRRGVWVYDVAFN